MTTIDKDGNVLPSAGSAHGFLPTPADESAAARAIAAAHRAEKEAGEAAIDVDGGAVRDVPAVAAAVAAFEAASRDLVDAVGAVEQVEAQHAAQLAAADAEAETAAEEGRPAKAVKVADVERSRADAAARVRGTLKRVHRLREEVDAAVAAALPAWQAREIEALPGLVDEARDAVRTARAALTRALGAHQAAKVAAMEPHIPPRGSLYDVDSVELPKARVKRAVAGLEEASSLFEDEAVFAALRGDDLVVLPVISPSRKQRAAMARNADWNLRDIEQEEHFSVTRYTAQWGKRPLRYDGSIFTGPDDIAWIGGASRDKFVGNTSSGRRNYPPADIPDES